MPKKLLTSQLSLYYETFQTMLNLSEYAQILARFLRIVSGLPLKTKNNYHINVLLAKQVLIVHGALWEIDFLLFFFFFL